MYNEFQIYLTKYPEDEDEDDEDDESEWENVEVFRVQGKSNIKKFFTEMKKPDVENRLEILFSNLDNDTVTNVFDDYNDDLGITNEQLMFVLVRLYMEYMERCEQQGYSGYF
jgi:hypothetical protein